MGGEVKVALLGHLRKNLIRKKNRSYAIIEAHSPPVGSERYRQTELVEAHGIPAYRPLLAADSLKWSWSYSMNNTNEALLARLKACLIPGESLVAIRYEVCNARSSEKTEPVWVARVLKLDGNWSRIDSQKHMNLHCGFVGSIVSSAGTTLSVNTTSPKVTIGHLWRPFCSRKSPPTDFEEILKCIDEITVTSCARTC